MLTDRNGTWFPERTIFYSNWAADAQYFFFWPCSAGSSCHCTSMQNEKWSVKRLRVVSSENLKYVVMAEDVKETYGCENHTCIHGKTVHPVNNFQYLRLIIDKKIFLIGTANEVCLTTISNGNKHTGITPTASKNHLPRYIWSIRREPHSCHMASTYHPPVHTSHYCRLLIDTELQNGPPWAILSKLPCRHCRIGPGCVDICMFLSGMRWPWKLYFYFAFWGQLISLLFYTQNTNRTSRKGI